MDLKELVDFIYPNNLFDLLRVEALDYYDSAGDHPHLERWRAGQPIEMTDGWKNWLGRIRDYTDNGVRLRRIRVLTEPIGEYLRFECDVHYTANSRAGENIRVLTLPAAEVARMPDLYVVNRYDVAVMHYDNGKFRYASVAMPGTLDYWINKAEELWERGTPFNDWYEQKAA